jgi:hypothetical protein
MLRAPSEPVSDRAHGGHHAIDENERFHLLRYAIPGAPSRSPPSDSAWIMLNKVSDRYLRITVALVKP